MKPDDFVRPIYSIFTLFKGFYCQQKKLGFTHYFKFITNYKTSFKFQPFLFNFQTHVFLEISLMLVLYTFI